MNPILINAAVSAAGNIVHNLAEGLSRVTAKASPAETPAVPFSTLIDKVSAPTAATLSERAQGLSTKLGRSAEVAGAVNAAGASGPLSIQVEANGDTALRLPNGNLKPIQLSEDLRAAARELYQLRHPLATSATAARPAGSVTVALQ